MILRNLISFILYFTAECQAGEEYNHGSKSCDKCQRGHYKNNTGNFERCVKCPTGYTTIGEGATSVLACNRSKFCIFNPLPISRRGIIGMPFDCLSTCP